MLHPGLSIFGQAGGLGLEARQGVTCIKGEGEGEGEGGRGDGCSMGGKQNFGDSKHRS